MEARHRRSTLVVGLFLVAVAAWPAVPAARAADATGGTSADESGGPGAQSGGAALRSAPVALAGRAQRIAGTLDRTGEGQRVLVQLNGPDGWETVAETHTGSGGSFAAVWRHARVGRFTLRVVPHRVGHRQAASSRALLSEVSIYRPAVATMFGPGLVGRRTACRSILTATTVGVAHRTLPCGTPVEVVHAGRRLVTAVVDRGPFVAGVTWDLTAEAARRIGFSGRGVVGTMPVG